MRLKRERSDSELLVASRDDAAAFGEFYDRHAGHVLAFFRRRVKDGELAIDLTAETFAEALGSLGRYEPRAEPAMAWIFAIARHLWIDSLRKGQVEDRTRRALAMEPLVIDDEALAVIDRLAAAGALELLDGLSIEQRAAVEARHVESREYDDIAADLRCSGQVVRKRVSRGLVSLRSLAVRWAGDE